MAFIEYYIPYHGFPKAIINDKGTQFTSVMWAIFVTGRVACKQMMPRDEKTID